MKPFFHIAVGKCPDSHCFPQKQRCFLVVPSILFMVIQGYGMALEGIYKFRPHGLPEVMEKYNHETFVRSAQADYWMDMFTQTAITITYLAMLFFYYREIGPEDESNPATRSRYAQAFLPQSQPPEAQGPHPFRPVSQASILASNPNLRNSTTPPVSIPPMSLLSNLTYEQQQQLLKLQQHPLILQQFQPHPFQEMMAEPHSRGQHHSHHLQDQTPLSLFHHNPKF